MKSQLLIPVAVAALLSGTSLVVAQGGSGNAPGPAPSGQSAPAERAPAPETKTPGATGSQPMQRGQKENDGKMKPAQGEPKGRADKQGTDKEGQSSPPTGMTKEKNGGAKDSKTSSPSKTGGAAAGAKLTQEQRTSVRSSVKNVQTTNVNFAISIGAHVPRTVTFHPLPTEIITIYPDWRGYEFFRVGDQIIVVNPRTLEIVAVLDV